MYQKQEWNVRKPFQKPQSSLTKQAEKKLRSGSIAQTAKWAFNQSAMGTFWRTRLKLIVSATDRDSHMSSN